MKNKMMSQALVAFAIILSSMSVMAQSAQEKLEKYASIRIENERLVTADVELLFPEMIETQSIRVKTNNPKDVAVYQTVKSVRFEAFTADLVLTVQSAKPIAKVNSLLASVVNGEAGIKAEMIEKVQMVQEKSSAKSAVMMKQVRTQATELRVEMNTFESLYPNLVSTSTSLISAGKSAPSMTESKVLNYEQISVTLIRQLKEASELPVAGR